MPKCKKTPSVRDMVMLERLNAELEKEKAKSEYIAMMADVEIEEESEDTENE